MNHVPLVSAVMINYNRKPFLGTALESVCVQTVREWELIVVENGSTDGAWVIAEEWARNDSRIRLLKLPSRVPIPVAANRGIKEARGEYVARLDSDDVWLPAVKRYPGARQGGGAGVPSTGRRAVAGQAERGHWPVLAGYQPASRQPTLDPMR